METKKQATKRAKKFTCEHEISCRVTSEFPRMAPRLTVKRRVSVVLETLTEVMRGSLWVEGSYELGV
jgi:hypothetical protein